DGDLLDARTYGQMGEDNVFWVGHGTLQELSDDRLLMTGLLDNAGNREILFANFSTNFDDNCLGADWPLTYQSSTLSRETETPTAGDPDIGVADLDLSEDEYLLQSNYLSSEYCP